MDEQPFFPRIYRCPVQLFSIASDNYSYSNWLDVCIIIITEQCQAKCIHLLKIIKILGTVKIVDFRSTQPFGLFDSGQRKIVGYNRHNRIKRILQASLFDTVTKSH